MKKILMQSNTTETTFENAFKEFIFFKKTTNLSDESIIYYNNCFNYFVEYFPKESLCDLITQKTILEYINYLQETKPSLSPITINSYLRGLRVILYYFMELGYIDSFKITLLKAEKKIKETYTENELNLLLKKPDVKICHFTEYRDWAIINYLLATGNRISSVVNIRICDVDFNNEVITITKTKNRKQQIIPLSSKLSGVLKEYLRYRKGKSTDYLFCNYAGQQLSIDSLQSSIQNYNRNRGVAKTSIHLFRHTFAKMWILNGGDIFRLQKILGHSSLEIVKEYVTMFDSDLKRDFEVFSPLDTFSSNSRKEDKIKMIK